MVRSAVSKATNRLKARPQTEKTKWSVSCFCMFLLLLPGEMLFCFQHA